MKENKIEIDLATPEFRKSMQAASLTYAKSHYKAPAPSPEVLAMMKKQIRAPYRTVLRIASLFAVVVIGGLSIGIWTNVDGAYGGKQFINKITHIQASLDIEQEVMENGQIMESAKITNEKDIKKAKDLSQVLYVPEFIPSQYAFHSLTVEKDSMLTSLHYEYYTKTGEDIIITHSRYEHNEDLDIMIKGTLYQSPRTGESMYIATYEDGTYSVIRMNNDGDTNLTGSGDIKDGIRVMEGFRKY